MINKLFVSTVVDGDAPSESKGERMCRKTLEDMYARPFPKVSKMFINPETGRYLELDGFCESLLLAFEYQGSHHYTDRKQARRDHIKRMLCDARGIYLLPIPHRIPLKDIPAYIAGELVPPVLDRYLVNDEMLDFVNTQRSHRFQAQKHTKKH